MAKETNRYWPAFSLRLAKQPVIWNGGQKFKATFNIRNASITGQVGLIALALTGEPKVRARL